MRLRSNSFYLGLVVLSDLAKDKVPRALHPLEEGHLDEAVYALGKMADVVRWLDAGNLRPGNIPGEIFEYYDRTEKILDLFGRRAETVEFIAEAAKALAYHHPLSEGNRVRLVSLAKKLETAFDPFPHRQFERIETL